MDRPLTWLLVGLVTLLSACEEPGNVGLSVLGEEIQNPTRLTIPTRSHAEIPFRDVTGQAAPFLAGHVEDPLTGTVEADGYFDVIPPFGSIGYPNQRVADVHLVLAPVYVYGDTTQPLTLGLHPIAEAWEASGARADTTLPLEDRLMTFTFMPGDTLVEVPLPDAWVQANDTLLRHPDFVTQFHGFGLRPVEGQAVVGFDPAESYLKVFLTPADTTAPVDSVAYNIQRALSGAYHVLTTCRRLSDPRPLPGWLYLQDCTGPALAFEVAFPDSLLAHPLAVHRAELVVYTDTLLLRQDLPAGFVRPLARRLYLYGVEADSSRLLLETAALDSTGAYRFSSLNFANIFQQMLLQDFQFERLELNVPFSLNSISVTGMDTLHQPPVFRIVGVPTVQ